MPDVILATEFAISRSKQLSNSQLLNFMTEHQPPEAKSQAPLIGCPGISTSGTCGSGPHRGSWNFNGVAYFVSGIGLYMLVDADDPSAMGTLVGSGIFGNGRVSMSDNGKQLCIVNGQNGWIYTIAGGLVQITSPAFYPAVTVTFMDGYFIFDRNGTNEWFLSALYDGLTYNGLDFASAEAQPGFVIGTVQNLQLLFIFCTEHIEIWYDAGSADFPFARYSGGIINYGCISPFTVTKQDGAIFFLGADHIYYRLQANAPIRISTHPVEHVIEQSPVITDAYSITWAWEGHKFVLLTLPSANITVCFDISTGKWHQRDSVDANFNSLGIWRPATVLAAYDDVIFGDSLSGKVGELDWYTYTEFDNPMRGIIQSMNQQRDRHRVFCSRFEIEVQAGVGTQTGQGADPQIMLRRSVDGGMTWSLAQLWRSMGKIGEWLQRLRWMRQGQGRQMCWQLTITDPVPRTIISAHADIKFGM